MGPKGFHIENLIRDLTFFIFVVSFLLFSSFLLSFVQKKKKENDNIM